MHRAGSLLLVLVLLLLVLWPRPAWGLPASKGELLFTAHCAACHVGGGNIIRRGKTLRLDALTRNGFTEQAAIAAIAAAGTGQMSGYAEALGEGGPDAVASYVWCMAQAGWPGRPSP